MGIESLALDAEGEYTIVAEALGGINVVISPTSQTVINLFDIETETTKVLVKTAAAVTAVARAAELNAQGEIVSNGLYHPLIREPVVNDFTLYDRAILTGANASGKSTFMKSLAVNAILAQTIDTACCTSLSMPQLKVMTSMAIRDDVVSGESYYVREVRYLKRMLDEIGQGTMTLYVIDEILKGTNQKERLAASEAVLKYLTHFPGFCMIATHDIELVNKLQEMYAPYYFESHITENNVTFDYCIHPGRGGESNALALLRAFGFPDEIIQDANQTISSL